jgi:hypothetical protein
MPAIDRRTITTGASRGEQVADPIFNRYSLPQNALVQESA